MPQEITTEYVHHTDNAVLVKNLNGEDVWIPTSTINSCTPELGCLERGDQITFSCRTWIATEKELI